MKPSNLTGILVLTVILLVGGTFAYEYFSNPISRAGLKPKQVEQALSQIPYHLIMTNNIQRSFWPPVIQSLNPLKIYKFMGRHIYVIVLSRESDFEKGLIYIHDLSSTRGSEQFEGSFSNIKSLSMSLYSYSN